MAAGDHDQVALAVDGGDDLTYGDWEGRSNAIARGLVARGSRAGDRVGLLFDGRHWADFASAHLGVLKAGAVAVLLSPGAGPQELARAIEHSGATGLLCARNPGVPGDPTWVASPEEVGRGQATSAVEGAVEPAAMAELVYPPAPLAAPRAWARTHGELSVEGVPALDGCLVHAWSPGSLAGRHAMALVRAGHAASPAHGAARALAAVTLAVFDPGRLCALLAGRQARTCGLTPALAAALLASGAARHHDLRSVTRLVLSGPPSEALRAGLDAVFPGVAVTVIDVHAPPGPEPLAEDAIRAPVAVSQEGMLWHEQFTPGSFNLPCLVRRYQGPLDGAAMERALSELARRHQPLRSTFEVVEGEPRQVVRETAMKLPMLDLGPLQPGERDAEAARLLADATGRPFDLATGPLFEPRLVRLGPDDHLLVVRLHHTAFDDWSVDVFRRELSALYSAALAGEPSPLLEPPTTFADFCRRQRARRGGDAGDAQRSWWRRELDGAPLAVQLPIGGREAARPEPGEPLRVDLPPSLAADLRALAPRLRATPFMTVLAAFSVLLGRSTGQDDLLIATVVAARNQSDVEPLVGCFTKKVPLRLRLEGDPTFGELVARTRGSLLGSLSHQEVAFDAALQEALGGPASDHGVVPQVAVVFQGETPQQVKLALPGLTTGPYEVASGARRERHFSSGPEKQREEDDAPVWGDGIYLGTFLILSLLETGEGMALVARGVFHRPAARRLLEDFQALLADVAADPSRPISELRAGELAPGEEPEDDLVELRGFRARRSRLEAALARCPGVAEVAVAVHEADGGEPRLVAYVVADGGTPPTLARLRHTLWESLPGAIWPAEMVVVDALGPGVRATQAGLGVRATQAGPGVRATQAGPGVRATQAGPGVRATQAGPDPAAALLAAMWGEIGGRPVGPEASYWQDFSFLQVLAEARQAGLAIGDEEVVRSRTPAMLAAALAARSAPTAIDAPAVGSRPDAR